jgi:hypothetical protein
MHNLKEEADWARSQIRKLDAAYVEELKRDAALSEAARKRQMENGKAWEELLKGLNLDLAKFWEHQKADSKKAEANLKAARATYPNVPADILETAKTITLADEVLGAKLVVLDPPTSQQHWFSYAPTEKGGTWSSGTTGGTAEGDCGVVPTVGYEIVTKPRAFAKGAGAGFGDSNSMDVKCWFWFYVTGANTPSAGTIYAWPYLDLHGNYSLYSNDGWLTSKEAHAKLSISTRMYRTNYSYAPTSTATILDKGSDNIDQAGRVDFTGWNNQSKGETQLDSYEPLMVQVIVELKCEGKGSGSYGEIDFQTGDQNYVKIPFLRVWVP